MKTINPIHTTCKDCVFAIYDHITQTGCGLNYITKYNQKNIEVLEAYDDTKEFYIINNKKCIGYRENKWFKQFKLEDADISDKIKKYKETNYLDYMVVIDLKNMCLNELDQLFLQISSCTIQPKQVIIVRYSDSELSFPYSKIEEILKNHSVKYKWRIQTILDLSLSKDSIITNITSLSHKYRFIAYITDFNTSLCKIVDYTNGLVHEDLDQFEVISNKDKTCLIYSGAMYRFETFHGNNLLKTKNYIII